MRRCDVADMARKSELRVEGIDPAHRAITNDLGDDRCCRDRRALLVAVDDSPMSWGCRTEPEAVDEPDISLSERRERSTERAEVRPVQSGAIDLPGRNHLNRDPRRSRQDCFEEPLPLASVELLRVVQEPEPCRPATVEAP